MKVHGALLFNNPKKEKDVFFFFPFPPSKFHKHACVDKPALTPRSPRRQQAARQGRDGERPGEVQQGAAPRGSRRAQGVG